MAPETSQDHAVELLAKFFSKARIEEDPAIEDLFNLDDLWEEVYQKYRGRSFELASNEANKQVIKTVLNL